MGAPYDHMQDIDGFKMVCISCGKNLGGRRDEGLALCRSGGMVLVAHGNYGSKLFDPLDERIHLWLFLCDDCAEEKRENIIFVREFPHKVIEYKPWEENHRELAGQKVVDKIFDGFNMDLIMDDVRKSCPWDQQIMAEAIKKHIMLKMVDGDFPMQDILNVQVFLGPKENDVQVRIALDQGVEFFKYEY